jgi:hypothetical protein
VLHFVYEKINWACLFCGIIVITTQVGEVISNVRQGFIGGNRFYKVKIRLSLSQRPKDQLPVHYPGFGFFVVHFVYEKNQSSMPVL